MFMVAGGKDEQQGVSAFPNPKVTCDGDVSCIMVRRLAAITEMTRRMVDRRFLIF